MMFLFYQQLCKVCELFCIILLDDPNHRPIQVEDFAQRVALNRSNMEELFIQEYKDLEEEEEFSQHNARIPINRNKNRYINIVPCRNLKNYIAINY